MFDVHMSKEISVFSAQIIEEKGKKLLLPFIIYSLIFETVSASLL